MEFRRTYSGAPWEETIGYCRAIRAGNQIFVTGTAPVAEDGTTYAPGDGYAQARRCYEIVEKALRDLDADLSCVVRSRLYVTDISLWEEYARAHSEILRDQRPALTMVEVSRLMEPDMLIEIEIEAVCPND
jgi:enamine deaminase RidA (YjgF/YER057c/UK114 family)